MYYEFVLVEMVQDSFLFFKHFILVRVGVSPEQEHWVEIYPKADTSPLQGRMYTYSHSHTWGSLVEENGGGKNPIDAGRRDLMAQTVTLAQAQTRPHFRFRTKIM